MEHFDPQKKFNNHSIGLMSAERGHLSSEENAIRTGQLHKDLRKSGVSFHSVHGGYVENHGTPHAKEVTERSFLVMHPHAGDDNGHIHNTLIRLGKKYDQDSILHKPHNTNVATFHGTNNSGWPGMGNKSTAGSLSKRTGQFFTRLPSGHEFSFVESLMEYFNLTFVEG